MGIRFLYLPQVGFAGFIAALLGEHWSRQREAVHIRRMPLVSTALRHVPVCAAVIMVIAFGARTHAWNRMWKNEETLYRSAVRVCPNSYSTNMGYAAALHRKGIREGTLSTLIDSCIWYGRQACAIVDSLPANHWIPKPHGNLAKAYLLKARIMESDSSSGLGGRAYIDSAESLLLRVVDKYGTLSERVAGWDSAGVRMGGRRAIRVSEYELTARQQLTRIYLATGRLTRASRHMDELLIVQPGDPLLYGLKGDMESAYGRPESTAVAYAQAMILSRADSRSVWAERLSRLYETLVPGEPMILEVEGAFRFNIAHPRMKDHLERACAGIVKTLLRAGRREEAERFAAVAIGSMDCDDTILAGILR
jgi:tetratricopeptide (TPR) repeat protein